MVKWVNPTGDMTPARPETAAWLENAAQAMKRAAEGIRGELELSCIQWDQSQRLRWPKTAAATSTVAAGARAPTDSTLRCTRGGTDGCYVLLGKY